MLSVVIPAHDEEGCIEDTILGLVRLFEKESINLEILVINDHSNDSTEEILQDVSKRYSEVRFINNSYPNGFGFAVRTGLEKFIGDDVVIVMADSSDDPEDVLKFYRKLEEGYDCVFGSRFIKGGSVYDYPKLKLILNRIGNLFISKIFNIKYNDITNAFKMYRRETIEGLKPFLSHHFNLTVELPLKAIARGYSYAILPNSWTNRKAGESKLKLKEMGIQYMLVVLYCLIEKRLLSGIFWKN